MTCQRCRGLLIQCEEQHWRHWRCVSCGDRFDTQVLNNRWLYKELRFLELERTELRGSPT